MKAAVKVISSGNKAKAPLIRLSESIFLPEWGKGKKPTVYCCSSLPCFIHSKQGDPIGTYVVVLLSRRRYYGLEWY